MTKIIKIEVKNFKAISDQTIDFNGCSAIVTAGNNKGKTTLLRGVVDRMRGHKANIVVKEGQEKGYSIIELSDGSSLKWSFTEKSERFEYTTKEGFKVTNGVINTIGTKYFGKGFDIDKFLNLSSKQQTKTLGQLIGLDLEAIDGKYKNAYDARTEANRDLKLIKAKNLVAPIEVEKPATEDLRNELAKERENVEKAEIEAKNSYNKAMAEYDHKYSRAVTEIEVYNKDQQTIKKTFDYYTEKITEVVKALPDDLLMFFDEDGARKKVNSMAKPSPEKSINTIDIKKPSITTVDTTKVKELEARLNACLESEIAYNNYKSQLSTYNNWVEEVKKAEEQANKADELVASIQNERKELIQKAKLPKDFEFGVNGLLYKGFPLTNEQASSSSKYIAALKLNLLVLGEVRAMHFDASFLDKNSLAEIQEWADENELQLLIERPDFDGGEITYQLINNA